MATKIEIVSKAFELLGEKPIIELDTGNPQHQAASKWYDLVVSAVLGGSYTWRFATNIRKLSPSTESSPDPDYVYAYYFPSDLKKLYRVEPNISYKIYGNSLMINSQQITVYYTRDVSAKDFPDYFVLFIIYELASKLANMITGDLNNVKYFLQEAELQGRKARSTDSQQYPNLSFPRGYIYNSRWTSNF